jgi:tripartite-type tricarboxylate transporter receptor subunit TctC
MKTSVKVRAFASATALAALASGACAQDFYKGKTVTMLIPSSAAGGYDTYARLLARHIGQHLPGRPDVVPQNMPGAGGKVAVAYLANAAAKDGTVISGSYPQALTEGALGRRETVKYDTRALTFIGSMNGEPYYCFSRADAPVQTLEDVKTKELIVGATGQGSSTTISPTLLNNLIGTKFKVITGYPGSTEVVLAVLRNEVQGWCGMGWSAIQGAIAAEIKKGAVRILFQENGDTNERVETMKLARATDLARNDEDRKIMDLIYSQQLYGRPFVAPPAIPAARTKELRAAFNAAVKDPNLIADAKRLNVELRPMTGEQLQAKIDDLYSTPEAVLARARAALEPGKAMQERAKPPK